MSIKVASSRLIVPSLKRYAGFYQQLFQRVSNFDETGKWLIRAAERARVLRQIEQVAEAGYVLSNIPLREYQIVGQYYLGLSEYREVEKREQTQRIFEHVAESSSIPTYRARAMFSLAAVAAGNGDYASELYYELEAMKVSSDFSIRVEALKGIAVVRAKEGNHRQALKEAEALLPMLRYVDPVTYYDCLNSLAVELCEAGRLEEARNISNIVLACPYAFAYPEWRETRDEIELKAYRLSRSAVSFAQKPVLQNVVHLPERERQEYTLNPFQPQGIVVKLNAWKSKMVKEPNGNNDEENLPEDMTSQDMAMRLVELITENKEEDDKLRQILNYALKVFSKK